MGQQWEPINAEDIQLGDYLAINDGFYENYFYGNVTEVRDHGDRGAVFTVHGNFNLGSNTFNQFFSWQDIENGDVEVLRKSTVVEVKEDGHLHFEAVDHPKHYTSDPSGVECIQIARHRNFNIGNALKYLWRAGLKDEDALVEDLRKAVWYVNDEIDRLEGEV